MAWSIPTYDGIAAHGRPSNLRVAMFELIRGIDERVEACSGQQSAYTWWVSGTPHIKAAPTFDELEFLKCTGIITGTSDLPNVNRAYQNMVLIRDRIRTQLTLGRFLTESGGSTAYTIASMEAEIGRGLDVPVSVTEASWWQAMQDALDLMIHARTVMSAITNHTESYQGSGASPDDAWADLSGGGSSHSPIPFSQEISWRVSGAFEANVVKRRAGFLRVQGTFLPYPAGTIIQGDVVSAQYAYNNWTAFGDGDSIGEMAAKIKVGGSEAIIARTPILGFPGVQEFSDATGILLGSEISWYCNIETPQPATAPFDSGSRVAFAFGGLIVHHDLSSYLTDQS